MNLRNIVLSLALATGINAPAYAGDEAKVVLINSAIHGLIGGVGAAQHEKNFFEGFAKGFGGGTLVGIGKYWVGQNMNGAWGAKILNSIGTSITYNTASGRSAFAMIIMDLGPVMLTYDSTKGFKPYLLPVASINLARTIADGYKFDLSESLRRGTPMFNGGRMSEYHGVTRSNVIVVEDHDPRIDDVVRHELTHGLQYLNHFCLEPLLRNNSPIDDVMSFTEKWFIKLDYINYSIHFAEHSLWTHDDRPTEIEAMKLTRPVDLSNFP